MNIVRYLQWFRVLRAGRACVAIVLAGFLVSCEMDIESEFGKGVDFGGNDPGLIAAMGDSITAGYGVSDTSCYVNKLAEFSGKRVLNFGVGGARSETGASNVGMVLAGYKPGVLLIFYGANDVVHGYGAGFTISNLRSMIRAARANKTIPIIATLTPTSWSHRYMNSTARARSQQIRELALEENCLIADLWGAFDEDRSFLLEDGLHPNDLGHALIAHVFWEAMQ